MSRSAPDQVNKKLIDVIGGYGVAKEASKSAKFGKPRRASSQISAPKAGQISGHCGL